MLNFYSGPAIISTATVVVCKKVYYMIQRGFGAGIGHR
jgi:hypothetical protein